MRWCRYGLRNRVVAVSGVAGGIEGDVTDIGGGRGPVHFEGRAACSAEARAGQRMGGELKRAGSGTGLRAAVGANDLRVGIDGGEIAGLSIGGTASYSGGKLESPAAL